jgi:hypothetical protein
MRNSDSVSAAATQHRFGDKAQAPPSGARPLIGARELGPQPLEWLPGYLRTVRRWPAGKPVALVTGFLGTDNETVHGRPVGLALDQHGALLVADDAGNAVWRVSAAAAGTWVHGLDDATKPVGK